MLKKTVVWYWGMVFQWLWYFHSFDKKLFGKFLKLSIYKLHNLVSLVIKWYIQLSITKASSEIWFSKTNNQKEDLLEKYVVERKTVDTYIMKTTGKQFARNYSKFYDICDGL